MIHFLRNVKEIILNSDIGEGKGASCALPRRRTLGQRS